MTDREYVELMTSAESSTSNMPEGLGDAMTDREYVEYIVSYLAAHAPWMWMEFLDVVPFDIDDTNEREWLEQRINPKCHPLVSADWWDERGEPKLAELLRKQHEMAGLGPKDWERDLI